MNVLVDIIKWGVDRKFCGNTTPYAQAMKFLEEYSEWQDAMWNNDLVEITDALGDMFVVATMAHISDWELPPTEAGDDSQYEYIAGLLSIWAAEASMDDSAERYFILTQGSKGLLADIMETIASSRKDETLTAESVKRLIKFTSALCIYSGITLKDCLDAAYEEIKDRKGEWRGGVFVKESDL